MTTQVYRRTAGGWQEVTHDHDARYVRLDAVSSVPFNTNWTGGARPQVAGANLPTQSESDARYLQLNGDGTVGTVTMTRLNLPDNSMALYIGNDAVIGDQNVADTLVVKGQTHATQGYVRFGGGDGFIGTDGTDLMAKKGTGADYASLYVSATGYIKFLFDATDETLTDRGLLVGPRGGVWGSRVRWEPPAGALSGRKWSMDVGGVNSGDDAFTVVYDPGGANQELVLRYRGAADTATRQLTLLNTWRFNDSDGRAFLRTGATGNAANKVVVCHQRVDLTADGSGVYTWSYPNTTFTGVPVFLVAVENSVPMVAHIHANPGTSSGTFKIKRTDNNTYLTSANGAVTCHCIAIGIT